MADSIKYTYKPGIAMDAAKIAMLSENPDQLDRMGVIGYA